MQLPIPENTATPMQGASNANPLPGGPTTHGGIHEGGNGGSLTPADMTIYRAMLGRAPRIDPAAAKPRDLRDRVGQWMNDTIRTLQDAKARLDQTRQQLSAHQSQRRATPIQPDPNIGITLVGPTHRRGDPVQHG
jgi:hypothetical protein